jgi:hypothetical protein
MALQDELIRHLEQNTKMSGFDFGLQFLDTARMTYSGRRRDAGFWIENAKRKHRFTQLHGLPSCQSRSSGKMSASHCTSM